MCMLLLAFRDHAETPLLMAGNRDEYLARPAAPPALVHEAPRVLAGLDMEAGGTWMGRNEHGLLAALTNVRGGSATPAPRSRGAITLGLLQCTSAAQAADWLAGQPLADYRPFNVVFGDIDGLYFLHSPHGGPPQPLAPGFYALSNATLDDRSWYKVQRAHAFYQAHREEGGDPLLVLLQRFLAESLPAGAPGGPDAQVDAADPTTQVFLPGEAYGTVSSAILTAGAPLGDRYLYADRAELLRHRGDPAGQPPYRPVPLPW